MNIFGKYANAVILTMTLLLQAVAGTAWAVIEVKESDRMEVGHRVWIYTDEEGTMTPDKALTSDRFVLSGLPVINPGLSDKAHWIKINLRNVSSESHLILELAQPTLDSVWFYSFDEAGHYDSMVVGEHLPFSDRNINHQNYLFNLHIPPGMQATYLVKIKTSEEVLLPISVGHSEPVFESLYIKDLVAGIYFGIILVMIFYNLFIYFTVLDTAYLHYVFYILFVGLVQATLQGYGFKYLWPDNSWLAIQSAFLMPALSGFGAMSFLRKFLQSPLYFPRLDKGLLFFVIMYVAVIALSASGNYLISFNLLQINSLLISFYIPFLAYRIWRVGYRPAKFFLFGWTVFLTGVIIHVLKNVGVLPYNTLTYYSLQIGSALEVLLLSFALADRINILKKEKEESQREAYSVLQENQRIIREQNLILETKVNERTSELKASNFELSLALKDLRQAQSKLVDAEKMASLGQLTAGVAHEINNPINFVLSGVQPLRRDIDDVFQVLDKYKTLGQLYLGEKIKEAEELEEELDLPYIKDEINTLLTGISDGAGRTAEIVKGLKNFSRHDENDLKQVDLHEGLDSTLVLLSNMTGGDRVMIVKNYGDLPPVECFPGKINQVFMNILTNAIQAVHSMPGKGEVKITTYNEANHVYISVYDNGPGIPENIIGKVFDPFFTTKKVGDGTGLGLSIAYGIVEAHGGNIMVESSSQKGTVFIIKLPILHSKNE